MSLTKSLVIGAHGVIGSAIATALEQQGHQVVRASRSRGDVRIDLTDPASLAAGLEAVGPVDHVVVAAGTGPYKPLSQLTPEELRATFDDKVVAAFHVLQAASAVKDGGSITFTSGMFAEQPMPGTSAIATANAALYGLTRAAAVENERIRINTVVPPWIRESAEAAGVPNTGLPAADNAKVYVSLIESDETGQVRLAA